MNTDPEPIHTIKNMQNIIKLLKEYNKASNTDGNSFTVFSDWSGYIMDWDEKVLVDFDSERECCEGLQKLIDSYSKPIELTIKDVAKKLGVDASRIKIVDR